MTGEQSGEHWQKSSVWPSFNCFIGEHFVNSYQTGNAIVLQYIAAFSFADKYLMSNGISPVS